MKTATGNKKGIEAAELFFLWKAEGAPEYVTSYEAFNLTNGVIGEKRNHSAILLSAVAFAFIMRGGSVKDYLALKGKGE